MKNLSLVLASLVLFAGVSFAKPVVKKQAAPAKTEKQTAPRNEKKEKKAPSKTKSSKTTDKKAAK